MRQRVLPSSSSSSSSHFSQSEEREKEGIRLGWASYLYMALVIAGLIAIIVITSITLAKANNFKNDAYDAFHFIHKFYGEFHKLSDKFSKLKMPHIEFPKPPHCPSPPPHECKSDCTSPYRPFGNQYLGQRYTRYVSGHEEEITRSPNPRAISQTLMAYSEDTEVGERCELKPNRLHVSSWASHWGQFIDHGFTLTPAGEKYGTMEIDIKCDPIADPNCEGKTITIRRSKYELDENGVRQQINELTPHIDASNVYGSTQERFVALRAYEYGKLRTSEDNYMPYNEHGLPNDGGSSKTDLFLGGDVRANEQLGLTCTHTLWVREHNYWAEWLYKKFHDWSDEKLYWMARRIVNAEIQAITYEEFLPALLGKAGQSKGHSGGMPKAKFNPHTNPFLMNEFSTAAYRFGHSMVGEYFLLFDKKHGNKCLHLKETFFKPENVKKYGLEAVLAGISLQPAEEVDLLFVDSIRNFLHFADFIDLSCMNIMRGRDHGLPYYHELYHVATGKHIESWDDITHHKRQQTKLKALYDNSWEKIDALVGILAEDPVEDSLLGVTGTAILIDNFHRIRDSDPYYYEWDEGLPEYVREQIHKVTLHDVIVRNTKLESHDLPKNVFYVE